MSGGRAPRAAGDRFERAVVDYLVTHGYPHAERAYGAGRHDDHGDIDGLPGWIVQCRATARQDLAGALADAEAQCPDHLHYPVAIIKRRNHGIGLAYVVMTLETFAAIAGEAPPRTDQGRHRP